MYHESKVTLYHIACQWIWRFYLLSWAFKVTRKISLHKDCIQVRNKSYMFCVLIKVKAESDPLKFQAFQNLSLVILDPK